MYILYTHKKNCFLQEKDYQVHVSNLYGTVSSKKMFKTYIYTKFVFQPVKIAHYFSAR